MTPCFQSAHSLSSYCIFHMMHQSSATRAGPHEIEVVSQDPRQVTTPMWATHACYTMPPRARRGSCGKGSLHFKSYSAMYAPACSPRSCTQLCQGANWLAATNPVKWNRVFLDAGTRLSNVHCWPVRHLRTGLLITRVNTTYEKRCFN